MTTDGRKRRTGAHGASWRRLAPGLLVVFALAGCDGEAATAPEPPPRSFVLLAEAEGVDDGERVHCTIDWRIELERGLDGEAGPAEYPGTFSGETEREVLEPDGEWRGFHASYAGEIVVRVGEAGAIEVDQEGEPASDSPYQQGIATLVGRLTGPRTAAGEWTCAPLGLPTDDPPHIDSTGVATGDFIFRPTTR